MIPYDKRSGKIWYNSELVDWADAKIHILNHGLHYASCVFEGERVYDGDIFKLEEHTSRLFYSAKRMGMTVPYSETEINDACNKIIAVQKIENGYVDPNSAQNLVNLYKNITAHSQWSASKLSSKTYGKAAETLQIRSNNDQNLAISWMKPD